MGSDDRLERLRNIIAVYREFTGPFFFHEVISAIGGVSVQPLDKDDNRDADLIARLKEAASLSFERLASNPVSDVTHQGYGYRVKDAVRETLRECGLEPTVPRTERGERPSSGYPDFEIRGPRGRISYVLVKTYSGEKMGDTSRTLYLSPGRSEIDVKVTQPARHVLFSYRHQGTMVDGQQAIVPTKWAIHDLYDLPVDLKYEFHSSNRELYVNRADLIVAQGPLASRNLGL